MMLLQAAAENTGFVNSLLENYGLTGLAFGILLYLILRQNKASEKRIADLEAAQKEQYMNNIDAHKDMITQYVELVKNKTNVLADLTNCLMAIKSTLERLERKP